MILNVLYDLTQYKVYLFL